MLPIIAGAAVGGYVVGKLTEYSVTFVRGRLAQRAADKATFNVTPEVEPAPAPRKNTRRTPKSTLVDQAAPAAKAATITDSKPTKKAQGRPSLTQQLEEKIAAGEIKA